MRCQGYAIDLVIGAAGLAKTVRRGLDSESLLDNWLPRTEFGEELQHVSTCRAWEPFNASTRALRLFRSLVWLKFSNYCDTWHEVRRVSIRKRAAATGVCDCWHLACCGVPLVRFVTSAGKMPTLPVCFQSSAWAENDGQVRLFSLKRWTEGTMAYN